MGAPYLEPTSSPSEVPQLRNVSFLTGAPSLEPTSTQDQGSDVIMSKASLVIAKSENMMLASSVEAAPTPSADTGSGHALPGKKF